MKRERRRGKEGFRYCLIRGKLTSLLKDKVGVNAGQAHGKRDSHQCLLGIRDCHFAIFAMR